MARPHPGPWIALAAAVGAGALLWFGWPRQAPVAEPAPPAAGAAPAAAADAPPAPAPSYPVEAIAVPPAAPDEPLPALDASDAGFLESLAAVFTGARDLLVGEFVIPRLVATVDNLPRRALTRNIYAARPVAGELAVAEADGRTWLDAGNARRYDAAVAAFMDLDSHQAVAAYVRWYPLFERAWRDLGEHERGFNDRLVEVIDHLLAAPEPTGPVELRRAEGGRPRWVHADPEREAASAGHKAMWRLGPDHALQVKAKLRELRALLAGQRPVGDPAP